MQSFGHTRWIGGLRALPWRRAAAVLWEGSGTSWSPSLKRQKREHSLQSVRDLCGALVHDGKGSPWACKSCGSPVPWQQPKRTLPCSPRDWSLLERLRHEGTGLLAQGRFARGTKEALWTARLMNLSSSHRSCKTKGNEG